MRVIAAMSRSPAGRMGTSAIWIALLVATDDSNHGDATWQKESAPAVGRGACFQVGCCASAAVAEEAQHEQEQVDEVEIERQRAHDGLAADDGAVLHRVEHLLDLLRVPGGKACEDEHA